MGVGKLCVVFLQVSVAAVRGLKVSTPAAWILYQLSETTLSPKAAEPQMVS